MLEPIEAPETGPDRPLALGGTMAEMLVRQAQIGLGGGTNRSHAGHCQISAATDQEAVVAWLARYVDSPNTLANSRREVERLMLWASIERGKPLSSLTHEDLLLYRLFLAKPEPAERWVMASKRKSSRSDPQWRPFAGPLSEASIRQAMLVLNSLLSWLVEAGYLAGNPLSLGKRRRRTSAPRVKRFLEADLWDAVRATVLAMPQETARERADYARARWLFSLFFLAGLRISEVIGNFMGDFFMRSDPKTGDQRWWLHAIGKGGKERLIPATSELMAELMAYRRSLGLDDLPRPDEPSPLLFPVAWHRSSPREDSYPRPMTRSAVHGIVKDVFMLAADRWLQQGRGEAQAERLRAASSHWLRHTAGSSLANSGVDLHHVRDTLGHTDLSTTNVYVHGEDDARHAAVSSKHLMSWDSMQGTSS